MHFLKTKKNGIQTFIEPHRLSLSRGHITQSGDKSICLPLNSRRERDGANADACGGMLFCFVRQYLYLPLVVKGRCARGNWGLEDGSGARGRSDGLRRSAEGRGLHRAPVNRSGRARPPVCASGVLFHVFLLIYKKKFSSRDNAGSLFRQFIGAVSYGNSWFHVCTCVT